MLTLDLTPPEIEASVAPLWQQPLQPVEITASVSEAGPLYLGSVKAWVAGPDPAGPLNLTQGNPWQESFTAELQDHYTATVKVWDQAGNEDSEVIPFIYDGTPPEVSLTLAATSPYGHTITDTVYYGEGSGDFTVTAMMTDTLAGLNEVVFPDTTETGDSFGLNGVDVTSQPYTYNFNSANTFSDTVEVEVTTVTLSCTIMGLGGMIRR